MKGNNPFEANDITGKTNKNQSHSLKKQEQIEIVVSSWNKFQKNPLVVLIFEIIHFFEKKLL